MKLSITESKNFIDDCKRYEAIIHDTKNAELNSLYKRFLSQARSLDASLEMLASNASNQLESRNKLRLLRQDLEKKITALKENLQQS